MKVLKNKLLLSVIFVLIVIIIPSFIFSIYQYSSITDEEKVIDDVYKNQLESILFSINQYSVDVVNNWVNRLNEISGFEEGNKMDELEGFINQNEIIQQFNIVDLNITGDNIEISNLAEPNVITGFVNKYIKENAEQINDLKTFLQNDYQKVIGVEDISMPDYTLLLFKMKAQNNKLGVITIKTEPFILEYISPKTQQIAENRMNITVYQNIQNRVVYSHQKDGNIENIQKSKELWLLPNYSVGIELTGSTLNSLVKKRVHTVILLVVLFNALIILGIVLLYYNVKREIELAKIKSEFVSNVSHELRTPLAMISMYSETLLMGRVKNDEKRQEYYEIIQEETNRLNGIVNNILNFSRIENKKRKYHFAKSSLNMLVEEILKVYKYELVNKGFTCNFYPTPDIDLISIDKDAIKDAVINLISNSIKYSKEQKYIEIKTGKDAGYQYIEVTDKGIGISEKDIKLIFDKFYRVTEENLAHHAQGSGLGLSIVKHIMDAHKGKIQVNSKLNNGSTFRLMFPIQLNV